MLRGLVGQAKKAIGKRGRLSAGEKAALTRAAKQNDMSVTEFKKAAKADLASEAGEGTASDKAVAKRLKISVAELQKKRKAAKKKKKTPKKWTRSKKERAELARLKSQQRKELAGEQFKGAGVSGGRREQVVRGAEGRKGLQRPNIVESRFGRLKSKQQTPTDEWNKTEKFRQKLAPHADPQDMVAEAMGLRGTGSLPTAEEARALGLTVKKGGGMVKAKGGKFVRSLISKVKKKVTPKKRRLPAEIKASNKKWAKVREKRKADIARLKKEAQQAKISEAQRGAKVADRSKKTSQVAKRVLPHVSQVRNKLKGMSAVDLGQKYTGKELKSMEMKLKKADTPNKALLKRIEKARNFRTGMISSAETPSAHEALGLPTKWKKYGGKVGKKKQGYKARKDESIAMRVKKKRTKKQLKASRNESYGKWGKGKGKGKINRSGDAFVAKSYARRKV